MLSNNHRLRLLLTNKNYHLWFDHHQHSCLTNRVEANARGQTDQAKAEARLGLLTPFLGKCSPIILSFFSINLFLDKAIQLWYGMIPKSVQCHVRVAAGRELHARLRGRKRSHFEAIGTAMFTLNCYKQTISNDVLRYLSPFTQVFWDFDEK